MQTTAAQNGEINFKAYPVSGPVFINWSNIYNVNIKWFQMRIMHRIIETNVMLKEMGVINNNKCSFCLIAKDTANSSGHAFWSYWKRNILPATDLILFGIDDNIKTENVLDLILLLAKLYLYKSKKEKQTLNYLPFPSMLIHFMFMTYEKLTLPVPHVLQCTMYVCL